MSKFFEKHAATKIAIILVVIGLGIDFLCYMVSGNSDLFKAIFK